MASIDTLLEQVDDTKLREKLNREVSEMRKRLSWGLVFERHLPESTRLLVAPIKVGTAVWEGRSTKPRRFRVRGIEGDELVVVPEEPNTTADAAAATERIARADVLVEHNFAQPIYPSVTSIGDIRNGKSDRRSHAVVQGENYHALQALLAPYEGKVDVLYLDPPYNTGNRDWAYNNDYADPNDTYRPSKWLAFMERRLRMGRRLLTQDGVMVVTIDDNEVHHLGMLLEQTFPEAHVQMVTIVINPSGVDQGKLSRVEEYAFFCFFGEAAKPLALGDDMLADESKLRGIDARIRWESLLRAGASGVRGARGGANMYYPVLMDDLTGRIAGAGESMVVGDPDPDAPIDGFRAVWPVREDGSWGQWRISQSKLKELNELGYVRIGGRNEARRTQAIYYVNEKVRQQIDAGEITVVGRETSGAVKLARKSIPRVIVKTVWRRVRHNSGMSGSQLLLAFMGQAASFPFPKALYAVRDTLDMLTYNKPNALVLDFFAGSGTTLHATMLLNAEDGGSRRCVLVTNNELRAEIADRLNKKGYFRGDPEFEAAGVFEAACRPRITAALTGNRADGTPVPGSYFDGREYSEGFEENVEFFRLDYLDPAEVEFGMRFSELHPLLWLRAGGIGEREQLDPAQPLGLPSASPYAVLFDPSGMPALLEALPGRPDVTHVFIVADSADTFSQLAADLPESIEAVRLYRDYLETMRGATR